MANIVFFGTPQFAVPSLEALLQQGHHLSAVVTSPDKPAGRGLKLKSSPVKETAWLHQIPVLQPMRLSDPAFINTLAALKADLFVVVAFRMLPEVVWNMPPMGTYNVHSSLLPAYRGAAPINRAIMDGCSETGVTTFKLKHEIDTGGVLLQEKTAIGDNETAGELHDRLMMMGAALLVKTVSMIENGNAQPIPQESMGLEIDQLAKAPKIFSADCKISWSAHDAAIHNLIRGLSPFPGAFTHLKSSEGNIQTFKIYRSVLTGALSHSKPGTIKVSNGRFLVSTGNHDIEVLEIQLEGKKRMTASEFLRGNPLTNSYLE